MRWTRPAPPAQSSTQRRHRRPPIPRRIGAKGRHESAWPAVNHIAAPPPRGSPCGFVLSHPHARQRHSSRNCMIQTAGRRDRSRGASNAPRTVPGSNHHADICGGCQHSGPVARPSSCARAPSIGRLNPRASGGSKFAAQLHRYSELVRLSMRSCMEHLEAMTNQAHTTLILGGTASRGG